MPSKSKSYAKSSRCWPGYEPVPEKANMKREAAARNRPTRMGARRFLARRRVRNRFRLGVSGQYRRKPSLLTRRNGGVLANGKGQLSGILRKSVRWGFAPDFSAHVPGFPAPGATNGCVCGFRQGKPHEVRQRQETGQEIRVYALANMGHPSC